MSRTGHQPASLLGGLAEPLLHELPNGAGVLALPMEQAPLTCIDFWCRAGSAWESEAESGLAHFLEHMVFKGSRHLAAGEFDRRVEALGGSSNAATGFDDVHYHVLTPPQGAAEALDLLLDLVLLPRLEEHAFGLERSVVLEELAQSEDQPEEMALQRLLALACPAHPYGRPILGRREALLAHDPTAMAAFRGRLYGPDRCLVVLTGAVGEELQERARGSILTALAATPAPPPPPPLAVVPGEHRIALPRLEAARLLMAWWQPPADDLAGVVGADLASTVLAEGRRSRLVERLREQLRLVESIDLDLHPMECGSLALLEAVCDPDDLPAVRRAVDTVLAELIDAPPDAEEWRRAGRLVTNSYRFGLESAPGVASVLGNNHLWGRRHDLAAPLRELERWSPGRLQDEALVLLQPERACLLEAVPA
jgi:predicted Zn-dependent peptidase